MTEWSFRAANGHRITVEFKRGLEPDSMVAALADVIEQIRAATEVAA